MDTCLFNNVIFVIIIIFGIYCAYKNINGSQSVSEYEGFILILAGVIALICNNKTVKKIYKKATLNNQLKNIF